MKHAIRIKITDEDSLEASYLYGLFAAETSKEAIEKAVRAFGSDSLIEGVEVLNGFDEEIHSAEMMQNLLDFHGDLIK